MEPATFPGTLKSLKALREYVEAAASAAGLDRKTTYNLCLAIDEIATNAVIHGYEEAGQQGQLRISAEIADDFLRVTLEDDGICYDSTRFVPPSEEELARPLDERPPGGLGIHLALKCVDEIQYVCTGGGTGNRNIFTVHIQSSR
ncbi:ATP-binding protein [Sorangium sp. So ce291]|uniref:ATP-binding protein n=1 Tax=Sorangium sp. So ce291 TaxID=3133294 RepID=UPI003F5DA99D